MSIFYEDTDTMRRLTEISAAMGYAYTHLSSKDIIKFRQSMDIFLDKILDMMDSKTIDLLVVKLYKEKIRRTIIESNHQIS